MRHMCDREQVVVPIDQTLTPPHPPTTWLISHYINMLPFFNCLCFLFLLDKDFRVETSVQPVSGVDLSRPSTNPSICPVFSTNYLALLFWIVLLLFFNNILINLFLTLILYFKFGLEAYYSSTSKKPEMFKKYNSFVVRLIKFTS